MNKTAILLLFIMAMLLLVVGCERKVVVEESDFTDASTCFTCHNDTDGLLQEAQGQWLNSVHASGANIYYTNREGSDCVSCHSHQGFVELLETGTYSPPYDNVSAIHCFTCHAPHTTGNLTLRADAAYELMNGDTFDNGAANLCANCHHSRYAVTSITDSLAVTSRWGPHHGPQGDLINGSNGYEYADYEYENSSHATAIDNACIGCHMGHALAHDGYTIGGHSFNMVDEETGSNLYLICADCHDDADSYDFTAEDDYDHDGTTEGYQTEFAGLVDSLRTLLVDGGILDDGTGLPIAQTIPDGGVAGALYNFLMVEEDRSEGIHNFEYMVGLVQSAIEYLNSATINTKQERFLAVHSSI